MDHVANYRVPKVSEDMDEVTRELQETGCGVRTPSPSASEASEDDKPSKKHKKGKVWKPKRNQI